MTRFGKLMRTFARPDRGPAAHPSVGYAPELDGELDPGEVVWAWVPYEDDPSQGKDRPVLVVGRQGETLFALQLTSQDHDLDADDEARHGRYWMDIGTGDWDQQGRPSEVRLDRLIRLEERGVRREGAILDRTTFDAVIREARAHHDF
ncbi:MAG TPA: type II toxin-antitoxin system PemK/MazF family toxin [Nocardioidaceae bacterium]|nr:type II toxin-antitoxin system PemK/MazF family toxin [Nocardioidaceae bacterium]